MSWCISIYIYSVQLVLPTTFLPNTFYNSKRKRLTRFARADSIQFSSYFCSAHQFFWCARVRIWCEPLQQKQLHRNPAETCCFSIDPIVGIVAHPILWTFLYPIDTDLVVMPKLWLTLHVIVSRPIHFNSHFMLWCSFWLHHNQPTTRCKSMHKTGTINLMPVVLLLVPWISNGISNVLSCWPICDDSKVMNELMISSNHALTCNDFSSLPTKPTKPGKPGKQTRNIQPN